MADDETEAPTTASPPTEPTVTCGSSSGLCAFITDIALVGDRYVADYATLGFEPLIPGEDPGATEDDHHVHFFFDTTAAGNAGENGNPPGSWELWGLQRGGGRKVFDAFHNRRLCRSESTLHRRRDTSSRGAAGRRPHRQLRRAPGVSGNTEMTMTSARSTDATEAMPAPVGGIGQPVDPPDADPVVVGSGNDAIAVSAALDRAAGGRATRVAICGAAGSGRTHLIEHARRDAHRVSMRVLATHGRVGDGDIPYSSMLTLLHPVADRIPELPVSERDSLQAALELRAADVDVLCGVHRVWRLLTRLGDERPLLVTADDSDLMDDASLDVLAFALGRMDGQPVAALATADCHRSSNPLVAIGDELIVLDGLDAESLVRSVQAAVPATDWADVSHGIVRRRQLGHGHAVGAVPDPADQRAGRVACPAVPIPPSELVRALSPILDPLDAAARAVRRRHRRRHNR